MRQRYTQPQEFRRKRTLNAQLHLLLVLAERGCAARGTAVSCALFVGVGEFDQLRFAPCSPEQLKPNWQSVRGEAAGDNDGRQTGIGT